MSRWKFDDCAACRWKRRRDVCADCDVGELFEERDAPATDFVLRESATRFGEPMSHDEEEPGHFDVQRFADLLPDEDDEDAHDEN